MFKDKNNLTQQFQAQDPSIYAAKTASKDIYVPKAQRQASTATSNSSANTDSSSVKANDESDRA